MTLVVIDIERWEGDRPAHAGRQVSNELVRTLLVDFGGEHLLNLGDFAS